MLTLTPTKAYESPRERRVQRLLYAKYALVGLESAPAPIWTKQVVGKMRALGTINHFKIALLVYALK